MSERIDKNISALAQAARQDRDNAEAMLLRIQSLENTVATLNAELAAMRVQLIVLQSKLNGNGSTVK